ncbi:MAG: GNAT family N-acetyltransferase [Clostridia bacterium]|nr:GNAT family N-acetyltransferase [Clostridia bacterium]
MKVVQFFESDRQQHWLDEIQRSDWRAGPFLARLLREGTFFEAVGKSSRVLLLTEGDELISYCTYAEKDDIQPTELTPWIGFVYTFPARRGHRYAGLLFAEVGRLARAEDVNKVYLSTNHVGLYEKYGFTYHTMMTDLDGNPSRVYAKRTDLMHLDTCDPYIGYAQRCAGNRVYPLSVAQGFQDGDILFYDENDARAALFWHYAGFAYLSGDITEPFLERIDRDFMQKELDRRFILITDDQRVIDFFAGKDHIRLEQRIEYRYDNAPPDLSDLFGYRIEPISANNIRKLRGKIVPSFSWSNEEQFLKNGFGYVAMDGDTAAAVAFSAAVSTEEVDIGVETAEPYRQKGLAKALVGRMCREIVVIGKKPVWAHAASNTGSRRTALHAGFTVDRINTVMKKR